MAEQKFTIYVIDGDNDERELLVESALKPFGYTVKDTGDGNEGLQMVLKQVPDVLLLDLKPDGLSGTDFLIAIQAQAIAIPVIVIAPQGGERDALQAFRLGARDYLVRPVRETEMIQAVERALKDVRFQRERDSLVSEVQHADAEANQRLKELKTLMSIGKAVSALDTLDEIFERVIRAATQLTGADAVGFFIRNESDQLIFRAGENLTREIQEKLNKPVEDDLAALVLRSQETYLASGEGLRKYRPTMSNATSVIYAPLVVHERAFGLLWVASTGPSFAAHLKDVVSALADYAAIAIFNVRLMGQMRERTAQQQKAEKEAGKPGDITGLSGALRAIRAPVTEVLTNMTLFKTGEMGPLPAGHQAAVDVMHRQLNELVSLLDTLSPPSS